MNHRAASATQTPAPWSRTPASSSVCCVSHAVCDDLSQVSVAMALANQAISSTRLNREAVLPAPHLLTAQKEPGTPLLHIPPHPGLTDPTSQPT